LHDINQKKLSVCANFNLLLLKNEKFYIFHLLICCR